MIKLITKGKMKNNNMKEINGYPGYFITEDGKVWSAPKKGKHKGKWLVINPATNYPAVVLMKDKKRKLYTIHRLVAETYIPNPYNKSQVNHIDGNRWNNTVQNLEWVDNSENQIHAIKTGLKKVFSNQHIKHKKKSFDTTPEVWT